MTRDELKRRVFAAIDRRAEEIVTIGERIRKQPEMGFKEVKTARLVEDALARLGMSPRTGLAMTGVRGDVLGRAGAGPTFAIIGEGNTDEMNALATLTGGKTFDAQNGDLTDVFKQIRGYQ